MILVDGPVLEPIEIHAAQVPLHLNPLLRSLPEDEPERPYLAWDMLFLSSKCWRSDDSMYMSWWKGRSEPATFPRVTRIRLISEAFPWEISIGARNLDIGVTCGELIDCISRDMHKFVAEATYEQLPRIQRDAVRRTYWLNRCHPDGVPDGLAEPGLRRLDWLGHNTMFAGIRENDALVMRVSGSVLPCTFELVCFAQHSLPAEDIEDREVERDLTRVSETAEESSVRDEHVEEDGDEVSKEKEEEREGIEAGTTVTVESVGDGSDGKDERENNKTTLSEGGEKQGEDGIPDKSGQILALE
ncbi:hypothetical protein C8R44DRAFT_611126 [Mycena epipterygia]|nr:hypothetical protein C8R44DRAFT_611126 [Mycena epipterygia]